MYGNIRSNKMIINQVVSGGGSAPAHYIEKTVDANGKLVNGSSIIDLTGVTDIGDHALYYAYYNNNNLTGAVSFWDVTIISGQKACQNMCEGCTGITGVVFDKLVTIASSSALQSAFVGCTGITNIDVSKIESMTGAYSFNSTFRNCTGITSVVFDSLKTITGVQCLVLAFGGCTHMTSLSFPALTSTSFGSNTNQFGNMLLGVTGCTVHFPSNLQSVIGSWTDVTNGFGGTNTTVSFDLPATE